MNQKEILIALESQIWGAANESMSLLHAAPKDRNSIDQKGEDLVNLPFNFPFLFIIFSFLINI